MPKWASRITLEVVSVRVERVQEIAPEDVLLEGVYFGDEIFPQINRSYKLLSRFQRLWDSINAKRGYGWEVNPWVWVVEFAPLRPLGASPQIKEHDLGGQKESGEVRDAK